MFAKPTLLYNNILRDAQQGDDGTSYASCPSAFAYPNDQNKLLGVITPIADIPSLANLVGCSAKFNTTGNPYRIVANPAYPTLPATGSGWLHSCTNGEIILAIEGSSDKCAISEDYGITWTFYTLPASASWYKVSWNGAVFVAIIWNSRNCATSPDGKVWTLHINALPAARNWMGIASGAGIFCVVAEGTDKCATSPDGAVWTERTLPVNTNWSAIAYGSDVFCTVAYSTTICAVSADGGATWTQHALPANADWELICSSSSRFLTVAKNSTICAYSDDAGTTWTQQALPINRAWNAVANNSAVFCIIASGSADIVTSPGGVNWTQHTISSNPTWNSLVAIDGYFSALAYNGLGVGITAISADNGVTWPADILQLLEALQPQDVGDGFQIRAGLICAQDDPSNPIVYAADNHLAPRWRGTENAWHYIRIYAPNLLENGGFENDLTGWGDGTLTLGFSVETVQKLEGAKSVSYNPAGDAILQQWSTKKIIAGKTYRCIFKAKSLTGVAGAGLITCRIANCLDDSHIDPAMTGYQPIISPTSTWFGFDFVPSITTDFWKIQIDTDHTKKGGATLIVFDEFYIYKKINISDFIIASHNWHTGGNILIGGYKLSPLRSTATADINNRSMEDSFLVTYPGTFHTDLTYAAGGDYPIYQILCSQTSDWTPEAGEIYLGDSWELPVHPGTPFDELRFNKDGFLEFNLSLDPLLPSYRRAQIKDLFEKLHDNEGVYWGWDTDPPVLMESPREAREAPKSPYMLKTMIKLVQRL